MKPFLGKKKNNFFLKYTYVYSSYFIGNRAGIDVEIDRLLPRTINTFIFYSSVKIENQYILTEQPSQPRKCPR